VLGTSAPSSASRGRHFGRLDRTCRFAEAMEATGHASEDTSEQPDPHGAVRGGDVRRDPGGRKSPSARFPAVQSGEDTATPRMWEPPKRAPSLHWFHAAKLVSKIVVSTDPGRVEDPINLLLRERFFFLFLHLS
jgi:hypothetical protein